MLMVFFWYSNSRRLDIPAVRPRCLHDPSGHLDTSVTMKLLVVLTRWLKCIASGILKLAVALLFRFASAHLPETETHDHGDTFFHSMNCSCELPPSVHCNSICI